MALRPCPECGTKISTLAIDCPHCGAQNLPHTISQDHEPYHGGGEASESAESQESLESTPAIGNGRSVAGAFAALGLVLVGSVLGAEAAGQGLYAALPLYGAIEGARHPKRSLGAAAAWVVFVWFVLVSTMAFSFYAGSSRP